MRLENETLWVEFGDAPFPLRYGYKPTGTAIEGGNVHLSINHEPSPWEQWEVRLQEKPHPVYTIRRRDGLEMSFSYTLNGGQLEYAVEIIAEGSGELNVVSWNGSFLRVDDTFSYLRDRYRRNPWDSARGRGLWDLNVEQGSVVGAWPDKGPEDAVHACAYNGEVCCFIHSNWPIKPLWTQLASHETFPARSGSLAIGLNDWQYKVRGRTTPLFRATIGFSGDLNGDERADECEYQLVLRERLPEPDRLYKERIWYKVFCATPERVDTTFAQALDIAKIISEASGGAPQVMYLVGWQYEGHDTGYPAMDRLNGRLGTKDDLDRLIREAEDRYDCIVSLHTNVDDAYPDHPHWDEALIGLDVDGSLMGWEPFNGVQSYHITHTKDVESGAAFKRLETMLALAPVRRTIHFDAFRTMNWSWEKDGFIGEAEEFFCGMMPILDFMKAKGIDVTTESLNGMGIEPAGVFSALWHHGDLLPLLYHNRIYGGGRGRHPLGWVAGTGINRDYMAKDSENGASGIVEQIAMDSMLYRFLLRHEMIEYRYDGHASAYARYSNGITATGDQEQGRLNMTWNGTLLADATTRFLPFDSFIYVFAMEDGELTRKLPDSWRGIRLAVRPLLESSARPEAIIEGDDVRIEVQAKRPLILSRA